MRLLRCAAGSADCANLLASWHATMNLNSDLTCGPNGLRSYALPLAISNRAGRLNRLIDS
jgi:hypothetical protein